MGVTNHLLIGMILQVGLDKFFEQPTVMTLNVWMASLVISSTIEQLNTSSASPLQTSSTKRNKQNHQQNPQDTHINPWFFFGALKKYHSNHLGKLEKNPKPESFGAFWGTLPLGNHHHLGGIPQPSVPWPPNGSWPTPAPAGLRSPGCVSASADPVVETIVFQQWWLC